MGWSAPRFLRHGSTAVGSVNVIVVPDPGLSASGGISSDVCEKCSLGTALIFQ
jgi:hypothetical protein